MPRYQEMIGALVANVELAEGLLTSIAHEIWNNQRQLTRRRRLRKHQRPPPASFRVSAPCTEFQAKLSSD